METDLNSQDRKDLDKFIKFFALKVIYLFSWLRTVRNNFRASPFLEIQNNSLQLAHFKGYFCLL